MTNYLKYPTAKRANAPTYDLNVIIQEDAKKAIKEELYAIELYAGLPSEVATIEDSVARINDLLKELK